MLIVIRLVTFHTGIMRKLLPLAMLLLVGLAGCGGGGGGSSTTPTVDHPTFQISWPTRSRDPLTHNLTSAQSVLVTLVHADPTGNDVQVRIDRDASKGDAYVGTYTVPQKVNKTFTSLTANFYSSPGEAGEVVGTASAVVGVGASSLSLGSITVVGKIETVTVVPPGTLTTGTAAVQLQASALDHVGAIVAVSAGSVSWRVASGNAVTVTNDGMATPALAGSATVVATIDGVSSLAATVTVQDANISGASFKITWPLRTRGSLAHSLNSAQSAEVTLVNAAADGSDLVIKVNRDATLLAAHTEVYTVGQPVAPTVTALTAKFYSGVDKTGDVVGTASAAVTPTGTKLELANVVVSGTVKSVHVIDPGTMQLGDSGVQFMAEALDADLNPVAVSAGSLKWSVVSGGAHLTLTQDGVATAVSKGTAKVKTVVDGLSSPNATITVGDPETGADLQTIDLSTSELTYNAASGKIWAAVLADDATYANCVVSIDPSTGAIGDKISVGTTPGHIAVSDDGKYAYVSISNSKIRRLDLTTHAVDTTFTVDEGSEYFDIEVVPGSPKSFAVATDPLFGVNLSVWDNGVRRNNTGAAGYKIHFASPTLIYGDGHDSLFVDTLSAGQLSWTDQIPINVAGMDYADGHAFNRDGQVIDPVAKSVVMSFPTTHFLIDRVLSASTSDNRVYYVTWDSGKDKRILSYDMTTGTEMPVRSTGIFLGGVNSVAACGNHQAVFLLFGSGVKRTPIIARNLP